MADTVAQTLRDALMARGLSPVHAGVLVGNMQQESGLNPGAVNAAEDAHGLLQWRQSRWQGLQDFARARGGNPNDQNTQLDYMMHEMSGPEAKSAGPFLAATDLPTANRALKGYIRYGDDSEGTRLSNAQQLLSGSVTNQPQQAVAQQAAYSPPALDQPQLSQDNSPSIASTLTRFAPTFGSNSQNSTSSNMTGTDDPVNSYLEDQRLQKTLSPRTYAQLRTQRRT